LRDQDSLVKRTRNRFRRPAKIKNGREISKILRRGERRKCRLFEIYYSKNEIGYNRIGIIVAKENGAATARNYLKRETREFFRKTTELLSLPHHYDFLIKFHPEIVPKTNFEVESSLKKWYKRVKKQLHL
jgi:ribonuclease P protein component